VAALGLVRLVRSDLFDGLAHLSILSAYGAATPARRSSV
jgi:hypothetical protein